MVMCARCKKNMAVVFVTRVENGKTKSEGLCLKCARELGVDLSKSMEAMGVSPEEIDKFEEQMAEIMAMPENGDYDLARVQNELGFEKGSFTADPQFKDFDNCDFSLKESSPAFTLGFKQIRTDDVGITL